MWSADAITTLEELGVDQWGLVTTGQAETYGVSRVDLGRLRDNEIIHRARRGVYSLPSTGYGPLQDLRAAWLATNPRATAEARAEQGDDVVVSHVSAASVHELGDLIPSIHEFTSPRRHQSTHEDVRFHRLELPKKDRALVDGLPVTSVLRTVEDLASTGIDLDHLADVVRDALAKPEVRPESLASRLNRVARRYGHDSGDELMADCLDRAGLPTVAANLAGLPAFSKTLMEALPSHISTGFLDSVVRQSMSNELRETINRTLGTMVTEQMRELLQQQNPAVRAVQDQSAEMMQKNLAPLRDAQAQALRPALEALRKSSAKSLSDLGVGPYWTLDSERDEGTDSPGEDEPSRDEEDPEA